MRHRKKGNHLGRTASHKKALMRNMAAQVIEHKEIKTTLAKAKELRGYVERLITYGKKGSVQHRRLAFKYLQDKYAVTSLFDEIAPLYEDRNGGYTRIVKLGTRKGDGAEMSVLQLVGFEKGGEAKKTKAEKKAKAQKKETKKEVAVAEEAQKKIEEKPAEAEKESVERSEPEIPEETAETDEAKEPEK